MGRLPVIDGLPRANTWRAGKAVVLPQLLGSVPVKVALCRSSLVRDGKEPLAAHCNGRLPVSKAKCILWSTVFWLYLLLCLFALLAVVG